MRGSTPRIATLVGLFGTLVSMLLASAAPAAAQDSAPPSDWESLSLRVLEVTPSGRATVDRGELDGLRVGDAVLFFPRESGTLRGVVIDLDTRSADVQLDGDAQRLSPGVGGEARLPPERFGPEDSPPSTLPSPPTGDTGDAEEDPRQALDPRWENRDRNWRSGMPLLSRARAVRPEARPPRISGRGYLIFNQTWTSEDARNDSQVRVGSNMRVENPFRRGGTLQFDGEYDVRSTVVPDSKNEDVTYFRVERLSYAIGGTRFSPGRFEAGRFLQRGLPEFGVVDGAQWETRRSNADRYGASVGTLPVLRADFHSTGDLAIAAWYRWNADPTERLSVTSGVQKTWHGGAPDRDLFVTKVSYLPVEGWDLRGSTWIDIYGSGDRAKSSGPEITQAIYTASHSFSNQGAVEFRWRRIRFAELRRQELLPVLQSQLAGDRYDRLSASGWKQVRGERRLHGEVGLWNDEDETGADLDVGIGVPDLFSTGSRTDLSFFATKGRFTTSGGTRVNFSVGDEDGRYDLFYELSGHRADGFSSAVDDFVQQRLRGSRSIYSLAGFDVFFDVNALFYDNEAAISIGVRLEESY